MLTFLTGKRQKAIAWFFFIVFYADMIGAAYASKRTYNAPPSYINHIVNSKPADKGYNYTGIPPIEATLVSRKDIANKENTVKENLKNAAGFAESYIQLSANKQISLNTIIAGPGPGQPEMSTFKSVGADNMVNLFTGDFSYNIPLLDVDGYPINIFYNAGPGMDQEASWVGLGWNINPGTINRNMRGLPDDFNGEDKVTKEMSMKPDITIGVNAAKSREIVGVPSSAKLKFKVGSFSAGAFYNSKRGLGLELGVKGEFSAHKNISNNTKSDLTHNDTVIVKSILNPTGLSAGLNLNSQTGLSPSISFQKSIKTNDKNVSIGLSTSIDFNSRTGLGDLRLNGQLQDYKNFDAEKKEGALSADLFSTNISFARSSYTPSIRMPITNFNASFVVKFGKEQKIKFKSTSISGYYVKSAIARKYAVQKKPAYGYMYYEKANDDKNALLDFNRLNDGNYTKKTPVISIPVYTYDVFSITGEGTGGTFRGYRGSMGHVRDPYTRVNSGKVNAQLDLGLKKIFHGGVVIGGVYSGTTVQAWKKENNFINYAQFKSSDKDVQSGFYFKNPGEKAIIDEAYYNKMGQDYLMRPTMYDAASFSLSPPFLTPKPTLNNKFQLYDSRKREKLAKIDIDNESTYRHERDKRTQVISFLTAEEADRVGLDKNIYSYPENIFNPGACPGAGEGGKMTIRRIPYADQVPELRYRKPHHISEITVQEGSKRYIYGLPVYDLNQKDVTISVENKTPDSKGQITYGAGQNSNTNKEGKDGLFQKETIDPYPHSFLLTAILSPDYSDVSGDGISDDDLGTAIKFNYSRANYNTTAMGYHSWTNMGWRLPASAELRTANFNRGLITDVEDDKATYSAGVKELWYTHSIESKNMVATFTTSNRLDGWGVNTSEDGGILAGGNNACQKKLDRIDLYSKADFVHEQKTGIKAKPIKTVHFTYTYKLCRNYSMFSGDASKGNGKLTLESIYFTYNNNNHQKNKYLFKYADEESTSNAQYNPLEYDRWGTYKPHANNPGGASNEDMPYTPQNKTNADANAAAWCLNKILLPSGAKIDINYEADDYAYVQNKRAAQMTNIIGFGKDANATPENKLFDASLALPWNFLLSDYRCVFFDATSVAVKSKEDVYRLYLQDMKQLLLKLWVKMPGDIFFGTSGYEPMFVYCNIEGFGVVPGSLNTGTGNYEKFYVVVGQAAKHNGSQIMETAYQFLRTQLPGKAYPGNDVKKSSAVGQVVKSLFALVNNIRTGVTGFENNARLDGWCKEVDLVRSGARLCNPAFKKLGGGHRVKSVIIVDNWKKMSRPNQPLSQDIDSYYGQEYDYTTPEIINGQPVNISSGVASYEPGVGNEENPFREVLQYGRHNLLAPTEISNIELPIAETFFPSPGIGYSRVTVKSIHSKNKANPLDNKNIKSGVGMQETIFYTTKDFPTISEWTDFDSRSRHNFKPSPITKIFNFAQKDYMALSQGFRVVLNDMNGKVKTQASYAENDIKNPINKTTYHYRMDKVGENKFKLNNIVPTVAGPDGEITNKLVGKDIEVMNDLREHLSFTRSLQVPLNVEFFKQQVGTYTIPVLIPTIFKATFRDETLFRSAATLKVVNEYGILDSVENIDKGSVVGTKNLVYNAETGDVMVSRTNNEFNKPIYNFSYPAYWATDDMGPAYKNIDAIFKGLLFRHGKIEAGLTQDEVNKYFASGDEIYVVDRSTQGVKEHPACDPNTSCGNFTVLPMSSEYRIWALDITKDPRNTIKEFIFIDRNGTPYNAANADIRIIRSGRRNMMDASVGSIASMANPILLDANNQYDKIQISNTTDVVNTGAMEYKEKWKTQDAFWVEKKETTVTRYAPVGPPITLIPVKSYSYLEGERYKNINGNVLEEPIEHHEDYKNFAARKSKLRYIKSGGQTLIYQQQSWLLFNFDAIGYSKIKRAYLSLYSHQDFPLPHIFPIDLNEIHAKHDWNNPHDNRPHEANLSGYTDNTFRLSRVKSTYWPGYQSGDWRNHFHYNPPDLATDRKDVWGPSNYGSNTLEFAGQPGTVGGKIDVADILNAMIKDKYEKQYITAFNIRLLYDPEKLPYNSRDQETRVCFNNYFTTGVPGDRLKPKIELAAYNCAQAYPVGFPIPVGQEVGECITKETEIICHSVFDKDFINPYVRGLLGNWRPLKSYVYNGERREQDPIATTTNIAKDGIIKDFEPFWNLDPTNNKQITKTNSAKWVWNSEITQYNRKGAELENKDPLLRYNASIYGYNEALPIAVVNNSKLRQSAFDGFEDYNFKDQSCNLECPPNKRHFDFKANIFQIDETQAHTGKYSLRTDNNTVNTSKTSIKIKISADNNAVDANTPDLKIGLTKINTSFPVINLQGQGLMGYYSRDGVTVSKLDPVIYVTYSRDRRIPVCCDSRCFNESSTPDPLPYPLSHKGGNNITWSGKIVVTETGSYNFKSIGGANDLVDIFVNNQRTYRQNNRPREYILNAVPLQAGIIYPIVIQFYDAFHKCSENGGYIDFGWKPACANNYQLVPAKNMYPTQQAAEASVTNTPYVCTNVSQIKPLSNFLIDGFNLTYDKKMVASVWVKKGDADCRCPLYDGFSITLKSGTGMSTQVLATFQAKSPIIEGWQLFETEFIVPSSGTELELFIDNTTTAGKLYVDDLRIHPYNSNMKSFVYNPYNLKPAAELDENNYATLYEYDDDGTLIRVKKETKLGVKTIQETRSSLQKVVTGF
jgi:hypothetical protein